MERASGRGLSVDESLGLIGDFGLGQRLQLLLVGGSWTLCALHTFLVVFGGLDPVRSRQVECLSKEDTSCADVLQQPYPSVCSLPRDSWRWTNPGGSLVSDFDLVCGRGWLLHLAATAFFLGTAAGCAAWQLASERTSRRRLLYIGCVLAGLAGVTACTAPTLWLFLLFRTAQGVAVALMGAAAYVLASDVVGAPWRTTVAVLLQHFFSLGGCLATLLAWAVPSWRWQVLITALCTLLYVASWRSVVESPSWLLINGRKGEATASIAALAFANHRRPPQEPLADPVGLLSNPHRSLADVLRNAHLRRRLLLLAVPWFATTASYFGGAMLFDELSSGLTGDESVYVTALVSFAYELPGIAAAGLAAERAGRKPTVVGSLFLGGTALIVGAVLRGEAQRTLAVASRFAIASAAGALAQHTAELFPAAVAAHSILLANLCRRLGASVAPGLVYVGSRLHSAFVPMLVFGSVCCTGGVMAALLPETLGVPQHETIQDLNNAVAQLGSRRRAWLSLPSVFERDAARMVPSLPRPAAAQAGQAARDA